MVNENIKVQKKALFKRFWWVGLIAVVLISVVVFIGSLGNKKIGPAQDSPTQKSPTQNKTTQNKADKKPKDEDEMPVLKNLSVDFGPYDPVTKRAGVFLFKSAEDMIFLNIGARVKGPDGWKIIPEFEYRTDPEAKVYAAAAGVVTRVELQSGSNDYEIEIKPNIKSTYSVINDHIKNVTLKVGDEIEAGQLLGTAGTWGNGLGRTELMVNKNLSMGISEHHCPFEFFDQVLLEEYKQNVSTLMKDWESFKGNTTLYDEAKDIWPGCAYEKLIEDSTGVHP